MCDVGGDGRGCEGDDGVWWEQSWAESSGAVLEASIHEMAYSDAGVLAAYCSPLRLFGKRRDSMIADGIATA
jgi:hypothetical protein